MTVMPITGRLIEQIVSVENDFHNYRDQYEKAHQDFDVETDARVTIFSRCIALLDIALLYLMFKTFQLPSDDWWSSLPDQLEKLGVPRDLILKSSIPDRIEIMNGVDIFWSTCFFIMFFSTLESSVRAIVRLAYPNEFNNGSGELSKIYGRLLSRNFLRYESLLELFRLSRNTLHNNGVYFPKKTGDNRTVVFKNVSYQFIDGKIVQLGDVANLLFFELVPELLKMINDIVNSTEVSKPSQILDPSR